MVYVRTADGNDALAWVNEEGRTVTESQHEILRAAACEPNTPALPRLPDHHALVQKAVAGIQKECLSILLRGTQPIIICPARSLENTRLPGDWKAPMAAGRLLILSPFGPTHRRVTADLAARRNELVAALAEEAWFAHITPGGEAERPTKLLAEWNIPFSSPG
jgi:hypothetical protein